MTESVFLNNLIVYKFWDDVLIIESEYCFKNLIGRLAGYCQL